MRRTSGAIASDVRLATLLAGLLLSGCATYTPVPLVINDQDQYDADKRFCLRAGANYKPTLNIAAVGAGAVSGAAGSATGGVVGGGLVVGVGALGGGTEALVTGLDAFGKAGPNVARHCMSDLTQQDRSAVMARPED